MRKINNITIAERRRDSTWVDPIRPGPAQTLSAPDIGSDGGLFGGDSGVAPCTSDVPTHRNPCGEAGSSLAFGWAPPNFTGQWKFFPEENHPLAGDDDQDPRFFSNAYLTPSFPFIEHIRDGAFLERFPSGAATIIRPHDGYRVDAAQEAPFQPVRLRYFGATWGESAVMMHNLSQGLSQPFLPYEILIQFHWYNTADDNRDPNILSGSGVYFTINDLELDGFHSSGSIAHPDSMFRVEIETKPFGSSADRLISTGTSGFINVSSLPGCGGTNIQESSIYNLRIRLETSGHLKCKLWLITEDEPSSWSRSATTVPTGFNPDTFLPGFGASFWHGLKDCVTPTWDVPCTDYPDMSEAMTLKLVLVNPAQPVIPCDNDYGSDPGYYLDTLIHRTNYWVPASNNVSYYKQIYFDGLPVFEGQHYWLDGLKVHPTDPSIFEDTLATAEVVIQ